MPKNAQNRFYKKRMIELAKKLRNVWSSEIQEKIKKHGQNIKNSKKLKNCEKLRNSAWISRKIKKLKIVTCIKKTEKTFC